MKGNGLGSLRARKITNNSLFSLHLSLKSHEAQASMTLSHLNEVCYSLKSDKIIYKYLISKWVHLLFQIEACPGNFSCLSKTGENLYDGWPRGQALSWDQAGD